MESLSVYQTPLRNIMNTSARYNPEDYLYTEIHGVNPVFCVTSPKGEENLEAIKILMVLRKMLNERPARFLYYDYKELHEDLTALEFSIQEAFGLKEDARFHRFWTWAGCECPEMDNWERHPLGPYVISCKCPVHGD